MFYEAYLGLQKIRKSCAQKLKSMSESISIQDIYIHPDNQDWRFGEWNITSFHTLGVPTLQKLTNHINILANITNEYHKKKYCEATANNEYTLKSDCKNKITRLLLPEFSLYTEAPLSASEFAEVYENILKIAKNQQPNVHLLLSSFSVLNSKNEILNITLYVECGKDPKVHATCKTHASDTDVTYSNTNLFSQNKNYSKGIKNESVQVIAGRDESVVNNPVFLVETTGGAQYLQAIDVCFEHSLQNSKRTVNAMVSRTNLTLLPTQADQILTSNSIYQAEDSKIVKDISHIDAIETKYKIPHTQNDLVNHDDLEKANNIMITETNNGFRVIDPPFGHSYCVTVADERKLGSVIEPFKKQIDQHNMMFINKMADQYCHDKKNLSKMTQAHRALINNTNILLEKLQKKVTPTLIESLFKTKRYRSKLKAIKLVIEAHNAIDRLQYDKIDAIKHMSIIFKDLAFKLNWLNQKRNHRFIKQMITKIETATPYLKVNEVRMSRTHDVD